MGLRRNMEIELWSIFFLLLLLLLLLRSSPQILVIPVAQMFVEASTSNASVCNTCTLGIESHPEASMQSRQRSMPHNASTGAHVITGEDRSNSIWNNNNNNLLLHPSSIIDVSHQTSSLNFQYPGASPHPPLHLSGLLEAMGLFNEFLSKLICPCYVCMMGEHGD